MGFIDALYDLGKKELEQHGGGEFADIDSFLQMPMDLIEIATSDGGEEKKKEPSKLPGREIRVWLEVADPQAECLEIKGIKKIEPADFWMGEEDERDKKRRYLYRDPVSPAAAWRYSPLYKLGGGVKDGRKALLGEGGNWREDKESRFYKLCNATLRAFEERGVFAPGSVDLLMTCLEEQVDRLGELWTEKKSSHLLIFSPYCGDDFLYPVEVKSFLAYFRTRLMESTQSKSTQSTSSAKKTKKESTLHACGFCAETSENVVNLDKVFAFATFDKKSFLPGLDDSELSKAKMFPLCGDCYQLLSEGRNVIDKKFMDGKSIYNVKIYTVPELLVGNADLSKVSSKTKDFIKTGLQNESYLSERVLAQDDELVYHFVFWEKNQAQERLLLMVEDVPPTRLRRLEKQWIEAVKATRLFGENTEIAESDPNRTQHKHSSLDQAMKNIAMTLTSLAGKNENDGGVLRDWLLGMLGRLLMGERVDVKSVKGFIVSRLQGLCSDSEWVSKWSGLNTRRMECVVDFLYRANER